MVRTPLLQIDRPMMDLAVARGSRIGLLATVPTTVPASERLLRMAAADAGRAVEVRTRLCSEAFAALKAGETEKHNEMLLAEIDRLSGEVDAIVLAQLSMSALEPRLTATKVPVFNSGRTAFTHIRKLLGGS
jgi:Asp/Glu/hydantoin racemase